MLFGTSGAKEIGELLGGNTLNLVAISIGAVFFGAATYIGNGPNFMVKAIADHEKIRTPTFLEFVCEIHAAVPAAGVAGGMVGFLSWLR